MKSKKSPEQSDFPFHSLQKTTQTVSEVQKSSWRLEKYTIKKRQPMYMVWHKKIEKHKKRFSKGHFNVVKEASFSEFLRQKSDIKPNKYLRKILHHFLELADVAFQHSSRISWAKNRTTDALQACVLPSPDADQPTDIHFCHLENPTDFSLYRVFRSEWPWEQLVELSFCSEKYRRKSLKNSSIVVPNFKKKPR